MQLEPSTAKVLGVNERDPVQNIVGGAIYLRDQIKRFGLESGIAAYNAGPGAVEKYHGVPPFEETRNYVKKVMNTIRSLGGL